jgi:diguanylate cyclase (GGDEF)-like protein
MKFGMKRRWFADIPLIYKIGAAPIFAVVVLFAVVAGASWVQERQTRVIHGILYNDALQTALAADSQRITADNGALYLIMAIQAAGGSRSDSQKAITKLLTQLNAIKTNLTTLRPYLPAEQRGSFDGILKELAKFQSAIQEEGSLLGVDFNAAANFIQPFEADYWQMTAALDATSRQLAATATERADKSAEQTALIRKLMYAFAAGTLLLVTIVEWFIVLALRRTVTEICEATEGLAAGRNDLDLERLARGDEFGAIVRSLTVFRENQFRIIMLRKQQAQMEARENASRIHRERLVRMISVLSETNEAILRAETREKLFQLVCEAAAAGGNISFTSIVVIDPISQALKIVGAAGPGKYVSMALDSEIMSDPDHPELVQVAIHSGKPCVSNDFMAEQHGTTYYDASRDWGIKSGAALPLFSQSEASGSIVFMSDEIDTFSPDFVELLQRLAGNLSFALENLEKAAEREQAEARIKYLATHDSLTHLPNRATFNQLLNFTIANARRYQRQCAVLFIDLDRFKLINDSLGHAAGDALLIEMAVRLNGVVRSSDVVARLGGDEFVILLNEINGPAQAVTVAHSLPALFIQQANGFERPGMPDHRKHRHRHVPRSWN